MKRFWQQSGLTVSPLLDTVSGIRKQNAAAKTGQQDKQEQEQFLRLPLESARRLRWFDKVDLNHIIRQSVVRSHIREKQELIELNDQLRKLLIEKGCVREDVLNRSLVEKIEEVDNGQVVNESVASVLLIAAEDELERLRGQLQSARESKPSQTGTSPIEQSDNSHVSLDLHINEEAIEPISLNFVISQEQKEERGLQDMAAENKKLREMLQASQEKEKLTELPSEMVTRAQNMCLKAEEEMRASQQKTQEAITQASRAAEKERAAVKEAADLAKKLTQLTEQNKRLTAEHKTEAATLSKDCESKTEECRTLVQRNITLRNEMDEMSLKVSAYDTITAERNALASWIHSLEESLSESKVMADRSGHYQQITSEMEERVTELEKELLLTAQKVGTLERQLKESQQSLNKEQSRNEKLMRKLRKANVTEQETVVHEAPDITKENLLIAELDAKQQELTALQANLTDISLRLEHEQNEKTKLLQDLSELEDRFVGVEKQHASSTFQLRRHLSVAKKDLEDCKEYASQLELERQNLCTKLHVKPDPNLGFEDARGGGTFHDSPAMSDVSCRNGLSAIDTLYLKNVLFKFIEATAKNKLSERDMLLPAIATLLGASSEEFTQLRNALKEDLSQSSKSIFSLWSR